MTEIPDIGIYTRIVSANHGKQFASLAAKTRMSFNLIYVFEDATAHENINKVLARGTSRWLVLMDNDVEIVTDLWLEKLLEIITRYDDLALVNPLEIKDQSDLEQYLASDASKDIGRRELLITTWNPAYTMMIDRSKLDGLQADEKIPGRLGMTDVDLCLQIQAQGFKVAKTPEVIVFHPWKPHDPKSRIDMDSPTEDELPELHKQQVSYMRKKWGDFFTRNLPPRILEIRQ